MEIVQPALKDTKLLLNPHAENKKYLRFLKPLSETNVSLWGKLVGDLEPIQCGYDEEVNFWILPNKGPRLITNSPVPNNPNYLIEEIIYDNKNNCYVIRMIKT